MLLSRLASGYKLFPRFLVYLQMGSVTAFPVHC